MRWTEWRRFGELFIECRLNSSFEGLDGIVDRINSIKAFSTFNDRSLNREYQDQEAIGFYAIKVCDKTGIERIFSIS